MLAELLTKPCTVISRYYGTHTDELGNEVDDELHMQTVCEFQQKSRTEPSAMGETSRTEWLLILLPHIEIQTDDAVLIDDELYEMVGDPWKARDPQTGEYSHLECTVRRVAGPRAGEIAFLPESGS